MSKITIRKSDFAEKFLYLNNQPFSLKDYPHMRTLYNCESQEQVYMTSRQVAKCVLANSKIVLANGIKKLVKDLQQDDELLSFDEQSQKIIKNKIKTIKNNGEQLIYKITTRTGRVVEVTGEHPFWTLNPRWTETKDLQEGDLIGLSRNNEVALPTNSTIPDYQYIILAHLLAEGGLTSKRISYTNSEISNVIELENAVKNIHHDLFVKPIGDKYPFQYSITRQSVHNELTTWLRQLNLFGCNSQTKFHPNLIYCLTKEQLCDYLRIWWNTDGHVSTSGRTSLPDIGIALISKDLIDGLQELLLRLGIHTVKSIQKQPKVYENTTKQVYKLRVEGAESIERFYELIPTRKLKPYRKALQNNNRLVVPRKALQSYFNKLKKRHYGNLKNTRHKNGWTQWALDYDLTYTKLKELKENLNDNYLRTIYNADIVYDRIVSIEVLPKEATINIEMENPYNTFLIDNLVTHNSTTLANEMVLNSIIMPQIDPFNYGGGFKTLYVSPSVMQTKQFSQDRLSPVIESSPFVKHNYMNSTMTNNVFYKQLVNGSRMYLRYALLTADRIRGMSADENLFDEVQDLLEDNMSVIQQTMSRSMYKRSLYAGTPKRTRGALASRWNRSTQNEWMPKCTHCYKYNFLDEQNIGKERLICRYCGGALEARYGCWVRTNPSAMRDNKTGRYLLEGFRVNILMFHNAPWVDWQKDIIKAYEEKSRALFFNEWLGLPYDDGVAPITEAQIRACCIGGPMLDYPGIAANSYPTFMGCDWGPVNSANSKTVVAITQLRGGKLHIIFIKRFLGREADYSFIHDEIPRLYVKWHCNLIGADYGLGEAANSEIRRRIGDPNRLIALQHLGTQKQKAMWNQKMMAYTLGRNLTMTELFAKIRRQEIVFPRWEDFEPYAKDLLANNIEYDEEKNKMRYINSEPDDSFHAILYSNFVTELYNRLITKNDS
jgi:intein/homing endonuclease